MSQTQENGVQSRTGDRFLLFLFLGVFCSILFVLYRIRLSFSLVEYPWLFPDSFDWIWNAFSYAQEKVYDVSHRGMFFSLVGAAAFRLGAENYLTAFGTLAYTILVLAFAGFASKLFGRRVGIPAALLLSASSNLIEQSAYVGCDVLALTFLSIAVLSQVVFLKTHQLKWSGLALVSLALCFHSQYIAVIVAPMFFATLFLEVRPGSGLLTLDHFRFLFRHFRKILPILLMAGAVFAIFFAPRWSYHHLIYTEKVAHGSLMKLSWNVPYYGFGLLSCLSWPLVLFSLLGAFSGLRREEFRGASLILLFWVLNVFSFFAIIYSWLDIRFLVYLFPPFFLFASVGIDQLLRWLPSFGGGAKDHFILRSILTSLLAVSTQVRSANSPFENVFYLSPSVSFEVTTQGEVVERDRGLNIPLIDEYTFSELQHQTIANSDFENVRFSEPMIRLFAALKRNRAIRDLPLVVFDRSSREDVYILRNRNRLYARSEVATVSGVDGIIKLSAAGPVVLIFRESELENLRRELGREKILSRRLVQDTGWLSGVFVQS